MKRARAGLVWSQTTDGRWRAVRAAVPPRTRSVRSERAPRPPSFRFRAAGAEDRPPAPAFVAELGDVVAAELAGELVGALSHRIGASAATTALVLGVLLTRKKRGR